MAYQVLLKAEMVKSKEKKIRVIDTCDLELIAAGVNWERVYEDVENKIITIGAVDAGVQGILRIIDSIGNGFENLNGGGTLFGGNVDVMGNICQANDCN